MKEYKLTINSNKYSVVIKDVTDDAVLAEVNGKQYVVDRESVANNSLPASTQTETPRPAIAAPLASAPTSPAKAGAGTIPTPIPGQIISINVTVGEKVRSGQKLLVLEAMKLENSITANMDGTVTEILVSEGDVVAQGQSLVVIN
jgi:glutaconyl-CoA/methylmalonyl-CoA decarboxylase subunit gamma